MLPPEYVILDLLKKRGDDLEAYIDLVVRGDSVLHRDNYAAQLLREVQQLEPPVVDEPRAVQIVKLDVVADLRNLAYVKGAIFLCIVVLDFLPSL